MSTPQAALSALATPAPMTLGHVALLEKIGSPIVGGVPAVVAADEIPSLYLLSMPSAEAVGHLSTLERDAFAWVDTLSLEELRRRGRKASEAYAAFLALMPKDDAEDGGPKKDAPSAATAG